MVSSENVTDVVWKEYIKDQKSPEPDDDFNVIYSAEWPINPAFSVNPNLPPLVGSCSLISKCVSDVTLIEDAHQWALNLR